MRFILLSSLKRLVKKMRIKEFLREKTLGFYLNAFSTLFGVVAIVLYCIYVLKNGFDLVIFTSFLIALTSSVLFYFSEKEFFPFLGTVFYALAAGLFFTRIYGTYVDYFNKINFWGDVSQIGIVTAVLLFAVASAIGSGATCFTDRIKQHND